ncbi:hypothetical protein ABZ565_15445 [Streptomyces sp. NPDC016469]|uniref:hypothetical protein n=1 Tax=Streptomyces sp. NPDC016469 TaxID=3157191 RepID=UPI0033E75889
MWKRILYWSLVFFGTLVTMGLITWALLGDLDQAGQVASVCGAIAGVVSAAVPLMILLRTPNGTPPVITMRAGRGSLLAQGSIERSHARAPHGARSQPDADESVQMAAGDGSVLSGSDMRDVTAGEESATR